MFFQRLQEWLYCFYRDHCLKNGPRFVTLGGGTGLPVLLSGLKQFTENITAIVTVADDGGSSGRLRGEFGILPPGDIRNCLVALAEQESLMDKLFSYRFLQGEGLTGHSLGNLLLTALIDIAGDFQLAVKEASEVLKVRGQVLPSTLEQVTLAAELEDGTVIRGETSISQSKLPIKRVNLEPECMPVVEALEALAAADLILLGPGSLYTSVLPNLLVKKIASAVKAAPAPKCYICNIMTQPGETANFTAYDHVKVLYDHAGEGWLDYIIVNTQGISQRMREKYASDGAQPVVVDYPLLAKNGVKVVKGDLLEETELVRHDSLKLAQAVIKLQKRGR